jgi:hypothetical protein
MLLVKNEVRLPGVYLGLFYPALTRKPHWISRRGTNAQEELGKLSATGSTAQAKR